MNILIVVLFLIAVFHFCLYYCNMDVFTLMKEKGKEKEKKEKETVVVDLSETKENLEKHLKELRQYNTHG